MSEEFTVSAFMPALPLAVYLAWLEGGKHSEMTGADAHGDPVAGTPFDAWDGYIHGTNVELEPGRRIVQRWRTAEFPGDAPDSLVEISLAPEGNGTRLTLLHKGIPDGQARLYEQGWHDHYFRPMQEYFIHAGVSGVPAGARVTEVIRKVQAGEAAPMPSHGDEATEAMSQAAPSSEGIAQAEAAAVSSAGFELAEEEEGDDFDTSVSETSQTGSEDWWKHLKPPTGTVKPEAPAEHEPDETAPPVPMPESEEPAPAARRPARRKPPVGAGKPARKPTKVRAKGRKLAARPGKAKPKAKARPKAKAQPKPKAKAKAKPKAKAKAAPKRKPAAKKPARRSSKSGGGKPAAKKPARRSSKSGGGKPAAKKPARRSSKSGGGKPAAKKPARRSSKSGGGKPAPKKKRR